MTLARTLTALLAIAQLLLQPVATWADAAEQREASARAMDVVHIEAHTNNGCPRVHRADCALCHVGSVAFTRPADQPLVVAGHTGSAGRPVGVQAPGASAERAWSARPRAPPALS